MTRHADIEEPVLDLEVFGRSPYLPSSAGEWVTALAILAVIAFFGSRAAGWPVVGFMTFTAIASYLFDAVAYIPLAIALAAFLAWRYRGHTAHDRPGLRTLREAVIGTSVFVLYEIGRHLVEGSWETASANADAIMRFQDRLRLDQEYAVQQFLLRNDRFVDFINSAYSWAFLPLVAGTLFWLFIVDDPVYRRFRISLAISAALAVVIMAAFPVAPPRLMPENNIIGTHAMRGGSHSFVNEYAAVPSLHVGWVALSGLALFVGVRHWIRWVWLVFPVTLMGFIVMATGHHYLVDGVVGSLLGVVPFLALTYRTAVQRSPEGQLRFADTGLGQALVAVSRELDIWPRLRFTTYSLSILLAYMIVREIVDPGFTNYWGYMVAQIAISIVAVLVLSVKFRDEGGLSVVTHGIIVVTTYADTLGTAGHMYDRFVAYDKITHFLGTAAVASAAGDILLALRRRGTISWSPIKIMTVAVTIAIVAALGWEVYEYYGDRLFGTGRHAGAEDTIYDIISDSVGAIVAAAMLYWWHFVPHSQTSPLTYESIACFGKRDEDGRCL
jgi:hypothetical protein